MWRPAKFDKRHKPLGKYFSAGASLFVKNVLKFNQRKKDDLKLTGQFNQSAEKGAPYGGIAARDRAVERELDLLYSVVFLLGVSIVYIVVDGIRNFRNRRGYYE